MEQLFLAMKNETESKRQLDSKTSILKQPATLPPRPDRKTAPYLFSQKHQTDDTKSRKSHVSKAKDTASEVSQGSTDMIKRVLYEKNEIVEKNKQLREELQQLQGKYEKLKAHYSKVCEQYLRAKKGGFDAPPPVSMESSILADEPNINIVPEPQFKFAASVDYGDGAYDQFDASILNGERSPEATNRNKSRPSILQSSKVPSQVDWLTVPASPVEPRQKALARENNQLKSELGSLRTEIQQLRATHSQCTAKLAKSRQELNEARREREGMTSTANQSTELREELERIRRQLALQYERLFKIKEIVKDVGIGDFGIASSSVSSPSPTFQPTEEQKAKFMLQRFFSEGS